MPNQNRHNAHHVNAHHIHKTGINTHKHERCMDCEYCDCHYQCSHKCMECYSWFVGCLEGVAIGLVYETIYNNFDAEEAGEGFTFGVSETIWCFGFA